MRAVSRGLDSPAAGATGVIGGRTGDWVDRSSEGTLDLQGAGPCRFCFKPCAPNRLGAGGAEQDWMWRWRMNGSKMKENVGGLTLNSGSFLDIFWSTQH